MSHDLVFTLCSLALLLGTIWLLIDVVRHSEGFLFSERTVHQLIGEYLNAKLHWPGVGFRVAAKSGRSLGGWSRIRKATSARQSAPASGRLREKSPV